MAVGRYVSIAGVVGVLGALVLLTQPAQVAEFWSSARHTRIADPAPVPCQKQEWYNADRACLSWTAPRVAGLEPVMSAPRLSQ